MRGLSRALLWYSALMANGHRIRAVGRDAAAKASQDEQGNSIKNAPHDPDSEVETVEEVDVMDLSQYTEETVDHAAFYPEPRRFGWLAPALAVGAVLGWTGLYGWGIRDELLLAASASPAQWAGWIIDWSGPVLLICVIWLLTMRHSRVEAKRFAQSAALLSQESRELEERLTVVNRELSLAREFLGAQSLELESLGRVASERISNHASELQALIQSNGEQVEAIGSASETALSNMNSLRDDLPVVANSARDVSNQVGNAGRTAHEQLDRLVKGFDRLNQFGSASENQVGALEARVGAILAAFQQEMAGIEQIIGTRLEQVKADTGSYRGEIEQVEAQALGALRDQMAQIGTEAQAVSEQLRQAETDAMQQFSASRERFEADVTQTVEKLDRLDQEALKAAQKRIRELNEEAGRFDDLLAVRDRKFMENIGQRQDEFATRESQASEVLAQRLSDLDDAIAERREAQTRDTEKLVAHSSEIGAHLEKLSSLIGQIDEQGDATRTGLTAGLNALEEQLNAKRNALAETETQLAGLTEAGVRLLEIIQSGARHSREDLPEAINTASDTLGDMEERAEKLSGLMLSTSQKADGIANYLITTQEKVGETDQSLAQLQAGLAEHCEDALSKLQGLRGGFEQLRSSSEEFAGGTQETLREALETLEAATQSAFTALDEGAREKVGAIAQTLSQEAASEIERALRNDTAETVGKLEQAASHASGVGREATAQLRDQLAKVNELTLNLEQRIERAREQSEEQVGNDFARRMALLTDSLNSNAIDIASAMSSEVTDTAWDAYLKGDRGIFTRRAVRLLSNSQAREIADLYQRDETFKANVGRYIHDFEAMLRSMLSTREGNALGVTILGSDVGKLYVALAQSIERFRQ